jgi:glycosyltransferase involved in cell wall biosynthesis
MIIIIPTKDRPKELNNTIKFLDLNSFFFKKIIIVDASTLKKKKIVKKIIKNYNLDIQIIDSKPSTCIQRNAGFQFLKNEKYIMFLDDDNIFHPDAFYRMKEFLNKPVC